MKYFCKIIVLALVLLLALPVFAQQGGDGNQGNGATFTDNFFNVFSLGVPGGPICIAELTIVDDINNWIRFNPNGSITVHWVGRESTIQFYAEGAQDETDVWIGSGSQNLHYTLGETERYVWHVQGTVTHQITGETRNVRCHVVANGDTKVFNLGFTNN